MAQNADALSGIVSAPTNAALDGLSVIGTAAGDSLTLQATRRGHTRGSLSGRVMGNHLFGSFTMGGDTSGSWMGAWSADPPRIADQWPEGAQLLQPQDVPPEPARLSSLATQALEQAASGLAVGSAGGAAPAIQVRPAQHVALAIVARVRRWIERVAQGAVTVGANVLVNKSSDGSQPQNSPAVAIDRVSNPNKIAVGAIDYSIGTPGIPTAGYYFSTDGGATWPARGAVPGLTNYGRSGNPSLAFDAGGRVFYAGSATNGFNPNNAVFVARALNGNTSYESTPAIVASSTSLSTLHDQPWIAVNSRNGYVFVCWTQGISQGGSITAQIRLARSTNNGQSFSTIATVSDDSNSSGCTLDVESNGAVDVTWIKNNNQIMFDRCVSDGTSCGTDTALSSTFAACNNVVLAGWDNGAGAYVNRDVFINSIPRIAVDNRPGGDNYRAVVWCGKTTSPAVDYDVYFTLWNPNSSTWLTPRKIVTTTQFEFLPTITIDENHLQHVVFYRRNVSPLLFNAYIALSGNGIGNFSTPVTLNDGGDLDATNQVDSGQSIGDYIGVDGATTRHSVWMDSRRNSGSPPEKQQDVETATVSGC